MAFGRWGPQGAHESLSGIKIDTHGEVFSLSAGIWKADVVMDGHTRL